MCKEDGKFRRQGIRSNKLGSVYLCSSENDDLKSSKTFQKKFPPQMALLGQIEAIRNVIIKELNSPTKRLTHNITSLNAHCLQEFYTITPQEELASGYRNQLEMVKSKIEQDTTDAAKAFLRVLKNNRLMKTELSVFQKLHDPDISLRKRKHEIRKVFLSAFHVFFQDFTDKSVVVNVGESSLEGYFDYEAVVVAFMHLADNATKYTAVNSEIDVSFEADKQDCTVTIRMLSIKIEDADMDRLFDEGFSGKHAVALGASGDGIGMNVVQRLLQMNGGGIGIKRNTSPQRKRTHLGIPYEMNEFKISFKRFNNSKESL
jgi:signal transduction histidine kinase